MKIAFDTGPLHDGNAGRGVGVYTSFLKEALSCLSVTEHFNFEPINAHAAPALQSYDLVHYPSFDFFRNTLPINKDIPVVVTVHDTIPLLYPKHYPPGVKGRIALFKQKRALSHVSAVITDSETSKKDIVRYLNVHHSKIFPIYLGPTVSLSTTKVAPEKILQKFKISYPYVLYIGDVNWNKNLISLCEACERRGIHLVIVGKRAVSSGFDHDHIENKPLVALQKLLKHSAFVHAIGFVDSEDLPHLIKSATVLCQPSYYEGFGLSVLDAMSLGTPTACAKTQALMEIYESATIFFDPYNVAEIGTKLQKIINDSALREKLHLKGLNLSTHFSWNLTAEATFSVYKRVLAQK